MVNDPGTEISKIWNALPVLRNTACSVLPSRICTILIGSSIPELTVAHVVAEFTDASSLCEALRNNVKKNLLGDEFDLSTATHAAGVLVADKETLEDLPQAALDEAFVILNRVLGNNVTLHQGVYPGSKPGLHLYTLVGGMKS